MGRRGLAAGGSSWTGRPRCTPRRRHWPSRWSSSTTPAGGRAPGSARSGTGATSTSASPPVPPADWPARGRRLRELPGLRRAFADGAVSVEKVQLVASVATPATDGRFTSIARSASVAQLQRICAAYRNLDHDDVARGARGASRSSAASPSQPVDSGLVRIVALLEPDEAALVLAALDARVEDAWRRAASADATPPTELSTRRADALAELATEGLVDGPDPVVRGERVEVRVHVDAEVLAGTRDDGICHLEGIGPVAPAVVRRLLCDARVCTVTEQVDGHLRPRAAPSGP